MVIKTTPTTVKVIASTTKGINGSMAGHVQTEIKGVINTSNQLTGTLQQHPQNVVNNINIDTSKIAYAMQQHTQDVVSSISNSLNRLNQQMQQHPKTITVETSAIARSITDDNAKDRAVLKQTLEGVSALQRDTIRDVGKTFADSLSQAIGRNEIDEDRINRLSKPFWENFNESVLSLLDTLFNTEIGGDILSQVFPQLNILDYLDKRFKSFQKVLSKLRNDDYETVDDLLVDLLGSEYGASATTNILFIISLVPLALQLFQATYAKEYVALQRLAMSDSEPALPSIGDITEGMRRGIFGDKKASEMMRVQGWSDDLQKLMFELSATQPIFTELAEMYRRGLIDDRLLEGNIEALGYNKSWVPLIKELVYFIPSPQDVIRFSVRDVFDQELAQLSGLFEGWDNPDYLEYTRQAGIRDEDARLYWGAHWIYPSVQMGYEMLQRGIISRNELEALLRAADIAPRWRDKLVSISYKVPTRVDNRNMFLQGVITEQETLQNIKAQGYDDFNANQLLNWYKKIKAEQNSDNGNIKQLSQAVILKAVTAGIMSDNEALQRLVDIGYKTEDAARLLLLNTTEQSVENEIDYIRAQQKRLRGIYEKSYMNRTISKQEARDGLIKTGLIPQQAEVMLSLLDMEYNIERKSTIVEQATKLYVGYEYSDNDYRTTMVNYGFTSDEIEAQIRDLEPFRKLRYRDLTTKQISDAVTDGLRSIQWGENQLRGNGYSDSDIEVIKELEQWEIPQVTP